MDCDEGLLEQGAEGRISSTMLPRIHRRNQSDEGGKKHNSREDRNEEPVEQSNGVEDPPKRVCRSHLKKFDIGKCATCQKDKVKLNKVKGSRARESLTQNISEVGSASLKKAAQIRNDSRMLLHIAGQHTIAMEIKYHRSC